MTSPAAFGRKLDLLAEDLTTGSPKATNEAAAVIRTSVLSAARARTRLPVADGWVRPASSSPFAGAYSVVLRLRTGFGYLAQLGSYKKPGGYEENNRPATAGRRRKRSKNALHASSETTVLAGPNFGPVHGPIHHPPQRATPFWNEGLVAGKPLAAEVWRKSVRRDIAKHFGG